jgi:hypothetical protein
MEFHKIITNSFSITQARCIHKQIASNTLSLWRTEGRNVQAFSKLLQAPGGKTAFKVKPEGGKVVYSTQGRLNQRQG